MASRLITDLSPRMQELYAAFDAAFKADPWFANADVTFKVTTTYRDNAEQERLYAQGRTTPGKVVTNARAGQSKHNRTDAEGRPASEAFDIVPVRHGKELVWGTKGNGIDDDPSDDQKDDLEAWQRFGAIADIVKLKWFGAPGSPFKEFAHFQNPEA